MIYNNETMLPYDAFKKDPLGRIKLHGGGGDTGVTSAPKPYDPTKEKDYIASQKYLDSLKAAIEKNNIQLTKRIQIPELYTMELFRRFSCSFF